MDKEMGTVVLNLNITSTTIAESIKKMESFTKLVMKLSEEDACHGMTKLNIVAKMS